MSILRNKAIKNDLGKRSHFSWRGKEVSRLEGFSDAVFAFAVTLLVVSLEVPHTFKELISTMEGFLAFAICFSLLIFIWYQHYTFFRRYGLNTPYIIVLNAILLFVVLFYIYPLKFLFTMLINQFFGFGDSVPGSIIIAQSDVPLLMIIYSLGFFTIFFIFFLFYFHAWNKRKELDLNNVEIQATKNGIHSQLIYTSVALLSILIAWIGGQGVAGLAGIVYFLIGPLKTMQGIYAERKIHKIVQEENTKEINSGKNG
jgi:uncharacterized membrane protein